MNTRTDTFLQQLDPRTKLVALLLLGFQLLIITNIVAVASAAFVLALALVLSPVSVRALLVQTVRIVWFILFITCLNTFTTSGKVIVDVLGVYGTLEGLQEGLVLSARLVLLLFASFLFAQTTRTVELLDAIESLRVRNKRWWSQVVTVMGLTVNVVPLLIQCAQQIKQAQLARGADADSGWIGKVRFAASAALPLFVSALRASQHLAQAMEARAFDPSAPRTPYRTLLMASRDRSVLVVVVAQLVGAALTSSTLSLP
ncbi:MAG: hypothetical protein C4326_05260 [Ignavibacteria bacterium]